MTSGGRSFAATMRMPGNWDAPRKLDISPRAYQELKSLLHRELLSQIDLERLTSLDDVHARAQVQTLIQDMIQRQETPLSADGRRCRR